MICDSYFSHTYCVGNREIRTFSSDYCHDNTKCTLPNPKILKIFVQYVLASGFGGLGVACWPLVPKFAGSNPAEAVGFLRAKKSSARLPSEGK